MTTITAFTTPPQQERKAQRELRENRIRAYVPTEIKTYRTGHGKTIKRRVPVAPGYVFAEAKPYDAKHVRSAIGTVHRSELARIYPRRDRGHMPPPSPFAPGDRVTIQRGQFATLTGTVVSKRGKQGWWVDVMMFGRTSRVHVAEPYMRKHDPG